jgi:hypothetical protein
MKLEDRATLKEIARRIKDRRAPPCPVCGSGGTIAGGQIGLVTCNCCGGQWGSLKACWKDAVKRSIKEAGRHWWRAPR